LADPLVSGPLADPDLDSLGNLLEYGMGLDPNSPDQDKLPVPQFVQIENESFLALAFQRHAGLTDVIFSIEISSNLKNWAESFIPASSPVSNGDGTESIILRHNLPIVSSDPRQMVRLKIRRR